MRSQKFGIWLVVMAAAVLSILSIRYGTTISPIFEIRDIQDAPRFSATVSQSSTTIFGSNNHSSSSHPRQPHPHAGARHADGSWDFIANVTSVRQFIISRYHRFISSTTIPLQSHLYFHDENEFRSACQVLPREGKERKAGWRLLTKKVEVDGQDPKMTNNQSRTYPPGATSASLRTSRILCAIYTYAKHREQATAVAETWGWKCDGYFAASTETIPEVYDQRQTRMEGIGSIDLPHLGPESYDNMWQKTRSILSYMHDYYLDDFDFFFLSGDDTYLIVENLRRTIQWLGDSAWEQPLYLGHWVPYGSNGNYFCGGGPGYLLNRKTLELLVRNVFPICKPRLQTSSEDRILGQCLQTIGIVGNHSVDATGAQRFHGSDPHDVCTKQGDSGYLNRLYEFWGQHYGFRTGFNLTSSQSVSFHMLKTTKHLKRVHAIVYKSCPPNTTIGDILGPSKYSS